MSDMAITYLIDKAKRAAMKQDWDQANTYVQQALQQEGACMEQLGKALEELASDCDKLSLSEVMLWAYQWVVQIEPAKTAPYLRLATYHERIGQRQTALEWLKRGLEMAEASELAAATQLRRAYRRIQRSRI